MPPPASNRKPAAASEGVQKKFEEKYVEEETEEEDEELEEEEVDEEEDEVREEEEEEEEKSAKPEQSASEGSDPAPAPSLAIPPFLQSVSDMEKLHGALSEFLHQYKSLNRSIDLITTGMDARSRQGDALSTEQGNSGRSRLQAICDAMDGKALWNYVHTNQFELNGLPREVPEAISHAPNPAKLVVEAVGRFYKQDRRAFRSNKAFASYRRTGILLLEFYLLSGCHAEDVAVKEAAKTVALEWRARLIKESILDANPGDCLGLILFVACFGIPQEFGFKEIGQLLCRGNLKKKANVLTRSNILFEKIPGVIKELIKEEMFVEAADLSCYFGLNDKYPPLPLLSSLVEKVMQVAIQERREGQGSLRLVNEANVRQLASLKSVAKCLEGHKLDARELSSVPIHTKIAKLEKDIARKERKSLMRSLKRKVEEVEVYKNSETQPKEAFTSTLEASRSAPLQANKDKPELGFAAQPLLPDSRGAFFHGIYDNSSISASVGAAAVGRSATGSMVNNLNEYPFGWGGRTYYDTSACYNSLGMAYPARSDLPAMPVAPAQHLYQPQASLRGTGGGSSGRDLYQFADIVIQRELQYGKPSRSGDPSAAATNYGRY